MEVGLEVLGQRMEGDNGIERRLFPESVVVEKVGVRCSTMYVRGISPFRMLESYIAPCSSVSAPQ